MEKNAVLPLCPLPQGLVLSILRGEKIAVSIGPSTLSKLEESRRAYLQEAEKRSVYGHCTGLGDLADRREKHCPRDWEERVLEEHSVQVGPETPLPLTRLFLLVRLNQLLRLPAPVRPAVALRLAEALERGITPIIRLRGSVGASGDLSPSAQAARCLYYGRGEALLGDERVTCGEALSRSGLETLSLDVGEALFLINNTAWSTSLCMAGALALQGTLQELIGAARAVVGIVGASREHYEPQLLESKNCRVGARIAGHIIEAASPKPRTLQAPYSIRCVPQILGASSRAIEMALTLLGEEACASTENPAVINREILHGCNFHAVKVSYACTLLQAAAGYLSVWAERLAAQLLRGNITGLPDYLAGPGSSVGAMIIHYTLASLSAGIRGRAGLEMLYTTPTSGLQEDIVSMAPAMAESVLEQARDLAGTAGILRLLAEKAGLAREGLPPLRGLQEEVEKAYAAGVRRAAPWLA